MMIIDAHTHIFPSLIRSDRGRFFPGEPAFKLLYESDKSRLIGAEELIRSMDDQQVDQSVVFGFPWNQPELIRFHNDYIIDSVSRYPDRLIGLCCFDLSFADAATETKRCLNDGLAGVGELATYLTGVDETLLQSLDGVMGLCRKNNLPVLLHANEPVGHNYPGKAPDSLVGVYRIIKRFPDNIIVLAHWGGGLFFYSLLKKEVKDVLKNVYFDTAASPFLYDPSIYRIAKDLAGIDKLLFGSDYPLIKPGRYFNELEQSGLSKEEIALVKGTNAATIFKLVYPNSIH